MAISLKECSVGRGPIVVAGAHVQGLVMRVSEIPSPGESVLGNGYEEPVDGGKATNQAVCAARLGGSVRFVTVLGNDDRGGRWRTFLDGEHIDTRWAVTVDRPTDVGFVLIDDRGIPAVATTLDANKLLDTGYVDRHAAAFESASMVVCQLEASVEFARAAFRLARANGQLTVLNPSPVQPLPHEFKHLTDVLVPNVHEAAVLAAGSEGPEGLTRRLHADWPETCIVLTAGEEGVYVCDATGESVHVQAPSVEAVDTIGAGDAFLGALAARLQADDELPTAIEVAVNVASRSVTRRGSIPSYGTADEVSAWAENTQALTKLRRS